MRIQILILGFKGLNLKSDQYPIDPDPDKNMPIVNINL